MDSIEIGRLVSRARRNRDLLELKQVIDAEVAKIKPKKRGRRKGKNDMFDVSDFYDESAGDFTSNVHDGE